HRQMWPPDLVAGFSDHRRMWLSFDVTADLVKVVGGRSSEDA
nr:hypothetical protein [Tanacetum cinerariifolium]